MGACESAKDEKKNEASESKKDEPINKCATLDGKNQKEPLNDAGVINNQRADKNGAIDGKNQKEPLNDAGVINIQATGGSKSPYDLDPYKNQGKKIKRNPGKIDKSIGGRANPKEPATDLLSYEYIDKMGITPLELNKLQIYASYLLKDQFDQSANKERFSKCFKVMTDYLKINLDKVYDFISESVTMTNEIDFMRFINGYVKYKKGESKEKDIDVFFNFLFQSVEMYPRIGIKDQAVDDTKSKDQLIFNSSKEKYLKKNISELVTMLNKDKNRIKGFRLVFEDQIKMEMYDEKLKNDLIEDSIKLEKIENKKKKKTYPPYIDSITHIGGIKDFLGIKGFIIKLRSGKIHKMGIFKKGEGDAFFLYSEPKRMLKDLKISIDKGNLTMIEMSFKETDRFNNSVEVDFKTIQEKYLNRYGAQKVNQKAPTVFEQNDRETLVDLEERRIWLRNLSEEDQALAYTNIKSVKDYPVLSELVFYRNQKYPPIGEIFMDEVFPPEKKSLCKMSGDKFVCPEGLDRVWISKWEYYYFRRPEQIFKSKAFQVFYNGVEPNDICQGNLQDCPFLSAVSSLATIPNLVTCLFINEEKSREHCYGVYLRINGRWRIILVDDFFPCYNFIGDNFAFTKTNGNELWVILLEKAWAKVAGSYAGIIGGHSHEIFDLICNGFPEIFNIKDYKEDQIWKKFEESLGKRNKDPNKICLMTTSTYGDVNTFKELSNGLLSGHIYTLLDILQIGNEKLVKLRNPWGYKEYSGAWSDFDANRWTPELKKKYRGDEKIDNDDGTFYIPFQEYLKYFEDFATCKINPTYNLKLCHISKKVSANGPVLTKLKVNMKTHTYIMMHTKNPKIIRKNGGFHKRAKSVLILMDEKYNFIQGNADEYHFYGIDQNLEPGTYYLLTDVDCRNTRNDMQGYNISSYSDKVVTEFEPVNVSDINVPLETAMKTAKKGSMKANRSNIFPNVFDSLKKIQNVKSKI